MAVEKGKRGFVIHAMAAARAASAFLFAVLWRFSSDLAVAAKLVSMHDPY